MSSLPAASLLPLEIWTIVLKDTCLREPDLKNIRATCKDFRDIVTPKLFQKVCFSVHSSNQWNLSQLLCAKHLVQHVNILVIDTTVYRSTDMHTYARMAEKHFQNNLGLTMPGFLRHNLLAVLVGDSPAMFPWDNPKSADIFNAGYRHHQSAAMVQDNYLQHDSCYEDLIVVLFCLNQLCCIYLSYDWHPTNKHVEQFANPVLDAAIENQIGNNESPSELIVPRPWFEPLYQRGWVFDGPGALARNFHPLHVPPMPAYHYGSPVTRDLVKALSTYPTRLQHLQLCPMTLSSLYVPSPLIERRVWAGNLYSLKALKISLHDENIAQYRWSLQLQGMLAEAIQAMEYVELLCLAGPTRFEGCLVDEQMGYELYKLLLEYPDPTRQLPPNYITCHRNETSTSNPDDTRNETIWLPIREVEGFSMTDTDLIGEPGTFDSPSQSPDLLRLRCNSPWPKLIKLELYNLIVTKFDLASLMIMVASSLRDLTLGNITMRDCPCRFGNRMPGDVNDWHDETFIDELQWYEVAIMLNKILSLEKCLITDWVSEIFEMRVAKYLGRTEDEIREIVGKTDNILGRYVLESKGESPSLWMESKPEFWV